MTRITWDKIGERRFEAGLDRGVLYTTDGYGVPWNGLTSVQEKNSGGDLSSYYLDGVRYLALTSREEVDGTIEAYTYPEEFGIHDGTLRLTSGLLALQQKRKPFGLSYRTRIGNDVDGQDYGYKIHILYNLVVSPSEKTYSSLGEQVEPISFSWEFSGVSKKPVATTKVAPLAHVIIDSTKTSPAVIRYLEEQLYGSIRQNAKLMSLDALFNLFEHPQLILSILPNKTSGFSQLQTSVGGTGDLIGDTLIGLYDDLPETRLKPTSRAGLYVIHNLNLTITVEDSTDPGTYTYNGVALSEDVNDPGTYISNESGFREDQTDEGTYLNGI